MADALKLTGGQKNGQTMSINIILTNFKGTEMEQFSVRSSLNRDLQTSIFGDILEIVDAVIIKPGFCSKFKALF